MLINGVNFGIVLFIVSLTGFLILAPNLVNFVLLCEIVWISAYFYTIFLGSTGDSLLFFIWAVLFLCIATGESVIGLSLIFFKFITDGTVRKFYGVQNEQRESGKGLSRFWSVRK